MDKLFLNSSRRAKTESLKQIRSDKKVPGVVYGHKFQSTDVSVAYSDFLKTFRVGGHTHIIELTIDGEKQDVLIHEVQKNPVSGDFLHVDFFALTTGEKIEVEIPLVLIGSAPIQREGALIDHSLHAVNVKCFPSDLVDSFSVDISKLEKFGDVIHVSDLSIDTSKYELLTNDDLPIVSAHAPKTEEKSQATATEEVATTEQAETKEETGEKK